jgi:DNA-binding NarL/FixJ family response regulator
MKVFIISKDQFLTDVVSTWIIQRYDESHILTFTAPCSAQKILDKINPNVIILAYDRLPVELGEGLQDFLANHRFERVQLIVVAKDINSCELVRLVSTPISAIIHMDDVRDFFLNHSLLSNKKTTLFSPIIQAAINNIPPDGPFFDLSVSELEVASLIAQGYDSKGIAERISRSRHTVESHRKHIKEKLGAYGGKNVLITFIYPYSAWLIRKTTNFNNHS